MSDTVNELAVDEKTRGRLNAYRQVIAELERKTVTLREGVQFNDGARKACAVVTKRLAELSEAMIVSGKKHGADVEELRLKISGIKSAANRVNEIGQDYLQEHLMLKGEARSINEQVNVTRKLYDKAIAEAGRKARIAKETEDEREARARRKPAKKTVKKAGAQKAKKRTVRKKKATSGKDT